MSLNHVSNESEPWLTSVYFADLKIVTAPATGYIATCADSKGTIAWDAPPGFESGSAPDISGATGVLTNNALIGSVTYSGLDAITDTASLVLNNSSITSSSVLGCNILSQSGMGAGRVVLLSATPGNGSATFTVVNTSDPSDASSSIKIGYDVKS